MPTSTRPRFGSTLLGWVAAGVAVLGLGAVGPPPVVAFPMTGCTLVLTSIDATGEVIDVVRSGAPDGTVDAPFEVTWDGSVAWEGSTGPLPPGSVGYHVAVFGLPTGLRGQLTIPDRDGPVTGSGEVDVGPNLPVRVAGVALVSGTVTGADGSTCHGSAWVRLAGSPVGTLPWLAALAAIVVGAAALTAGLRGQRESFAVAGGLLVGLGLAVMSVVHGLLPLAERTPIAAVVAGLAVGIGVAVAIGRRAVAPPGELPDERSGRPLP